MTKNVLFLQKFNQAFINNDTSYIFDHVTDDIRWTMVGDRIIKRKKHSTNS